MQLALNKRGELWRAALQSLLVAAAKCSRCQSKHKCSHWLKLLIRFAHRTPLARSEDSSGSAGRRLSIHAVDCSRLLSPCCACACAERRRLLQPSVSTHSSSNVSRTTPPSGTTASRALTWSIQSTLKAASKSSGGTRGHSRARSAGSQVIRKAPSTQ